MQKKIKKVKIKELTYDEILTFIQKNGALQFIEKAIKDLNKIEYPYQNIFKSNKDVLKFSKKIVGYRPSIEFKKQKFINLFTMTPIVQNILFTIYLNDSYQYDQMMEYFSEDCVRFCQRYDQTKNPNQMWLDPN